MQNLMNSIGNATLFIVEPLEFVVLKLSSTMPYETDRESSLRGSWYLSPKQHALEMIIFNALAISLAVYFLRKAVETKWAKYFEYYNLLA